MNAIADLHRHAAMIEQALDDLDDEERLAEADPAVIEAERETLGTLLARIEDRICAVAA